MNSNMAQANEARQMRSRATENNEATSPIADAVSSLLKARENRPRYFPKVELVMDRISRLA